MTRSPEPSRTAEWLSRLVAFRTENPPGDEGAAATWIGEVLGGLGFAVELVEVEPDRLNVLATLENGGGRGLALNSHLDVVPVGGGWSGDPFTLRAMDDGRLVARGACDAKGSVAAMMEAGALLAAARDAWRGRLVLAFVVDEETGGKGAVHAGRMLEDRVQRVVVGEPTDLALATAHKGVSRPVLRVLGRPAHSGRPELGDNAIVKAATVVTRLAEEDARLRKLEHALVGRASLSVTRIGGGIADNIVPPFCDLTLDRRILPGESRASFKAELEAILAELQARHGIEVEVLRFTSGIEACATPDDDPLTRAALAACRANAIDPPGPVGFPAGCDLGRFAAAGIPGVILGPGSLEQAHQPDEWVLRDDLARAAAIYRDTALAYFRGD